MVFGREGKKLAQVCKFCHHPRVMSYGADNNECGCFECGATYQKKFAKCTTGEGGKN